MILYSNEGLETAIKETSETIKKLASLKPTDGFDLNDINKAIYYIRQFKNECEYTKRKRTKNGI